MLNLLTRIQAFDYYLACMSIFKSRLLVSIIYILLFIAGAYISISIPESDLRIKLLIIDVVLTIIVFLQSAILKNASIYDLYWSVIPFYFLFYWMYELDVRELNYRMLICILLLSLWSWRLSINWFRGWKGLDHEDWRYLDLRKKTGFFYPIVNFLGIHLFPTILVFIGSLALEPIFLSQDPISYIDIIGAAVMGLGILFESAADNQMHNFKKDPNNKGLNINKGIWKYSRHPNYLGEILFWWGLYILSISAGASTIYLLGPGLMTFLFLAISIPMMEKRLMKKYTEYENYKKETSILLPFKGLF